MSFKFFIEGKKYILSGIIVLSITVTFFISIIVNIGYTKRVQNTLNIVANSASSSFWAFNATALDYTLNQLIALGEFSVLKITDNSDKLFVSTEVSRDSNRTLFERKLFPEVYFYSNIIYKDEQIGKLYGAHISKAFNYTLIINAIFYLIISIIIFYIYALKRNKILQSTMNKLIDVQKELNVAQQQASMGTLIRGLAHEFNTPLGNIITLVSSLWYLLDEKGNTNISDHLNLIDSSTTKMKLIINRLKVIEEMSVDHKFEATDVKVILENIWLEMCVKKPITSNIQFNITGSLIVPYSSIQMRVIFMELIENSVQYGLQLNSNSKNLEINVNLSSNKKEYLIEFYDSGLEIIKEIKQTMFNPFISGSGMGKSLGLGLHIVSYYIQNIVGGSIFYSRIEGKNCFTITMPKLNKALTGEIL